MLSERDRRVLREMERQFRRGGPARQRLFDTAPSTLGLPPPARPRTYTWTAIIAAALFTAAVLVGVPAMAMTCGVVAMLALPLRARDVARGRTD
jgi:hypothetical protein